jgi:hypothetical protein
MNHWLTGSIAKEIRTMIRRSRRLHAAIECAEARVLTSVAGSVMPQSAAAVRVQMVEPASHPVLQGSFTTHIAVNLSLRQILSGIPITEKLSGGGRIAPLGQVRVTGVMEGTTSLNGHPTASASPGRLTLAGPHGRITLNLLTRPTSAQTQSVPFVISGGAGMYKGATGDGVLEIARGANAASSGSHGLTISNNLVFHFATA